jgi:putative membrane-bound dehydrogenase-like protein
MFDVRCSMFLFFLLASTATYATDGPLSPEDSLKYLKTEPGLKVELVAAEPMVVSPVAIAWDEKGRLYVVENRGYPVGPGEGKPPVGQVVLLEDTDGDGKYDKRTVFADGLTFPNGVMPWNGGVYVTCAPYLYYFKDTDGDGKADIKQIVFKGFQDLSTTQLRVSHPTLNLDNWVYLTSGLTAAKVTAPEHPDRPVAFLNRVDGRFRPGTDELHETAGTAQFGQTFDRFGRKFICSNRNHIQQVVLKTRYLKRNPNLAFSQQVEDIPDHEAACRVYPLSANITTAAFHAGYITSACGITIYDGTALPYNYRGDSFTCEPAGNLVHHDVLSPNGVTFIAKRAYPTNEFLASPDNWFRPVNLANGPDGALYVCDMYRKTIEHPDYLPEATRKVTDFESGKTMGRIYRIVRENNLADAKYKFQPRKFDLSKLSAKELVAEFNNPNIWWRMTVQRLLLERQDKKAVSYLKSLSVKGETPEARVHALRTLEGLGALTEDEIKGALHDKNPGVREHAIELAEPRLSSSSVLPTELLALAADPDPRVRFQCALSLGDINDIRVVRPLARIALRNLDDKWTRAAVLTGINHREELFLRELLRLARQNQFESLPAMMSDLGRILGAAVQAERLGPTLEQLVGSKDSTDLPWEMAAASGFGDALKSRQSSTANSPSPSDGERVRERGLSDRPPLMALSGGGSPELRDALQNLFKRAIDLAVDHHQPLTLRLPAISLLGQAEYSTSAKPLEQLIEPQQPSEIQTAAIRALGQFANTNVAIALVTKTRWNGYTPAVRDIVLSLLMPNTNSLHTLFDAIQNGDVAAYTVNADRRNQLMKHKDPSIQERANALFKDLTPGDRMKVYEETKSILSLTPDAKNGHAVFQKNCTPCHTFAGEGHIVGPDLTGIRNQPSEVILLHIVVPEYEIMPIYTCYNVETKDGQSYTGILAGETQSAITLRMAQGVEQPIPRSNIASMQTSRLSLMPQELEKAMTTSSPS